MALSSIHVPRQLFSAVTHSQRASQVLRSHGGGCQVGHCGVTFTTILGCFCGLQHILEKQTGLCLTVWETPQGFSKENSGDLAGICRHRWAGQYHAGQSQPLPNYKVAERHASQLSSHDPAWKCLLFCHKDAQNQGGIWSILDHPGPNVSPWWAVNQQRTETESEFPGRNSGGWAWQTLGDSPESWTLGMECGW